MMGAVMMRESELEEGVAMMEGLVGETGASVGTVVGFGIDTDSIEDWRTVSRIQHLLLV